MKRILSLFLAAVCAAGLAGCGQSPAPSSPQSGGEGKLRVVSTIFPGYDFARQIAGDCIELTMLLPPGAESHSFEPSPRDIITIENCDVFIYAGGDSDVWVDRILASMDTGDMNVISMMDLVEVVEEERKEGMEEDHGHDHSHHGEIDPDHIGDRPLADWAGSWTTVEAALESGALDEYIGRLAEDNGLDFAGQRAVSARRWKSAHPTLEISGGGVTWNGVTADYAYVGYRLVEGDQGSAVWYGFEAAEGPAGAPRFIAFSDHGTGAQGEHDEHAQEAAHFHLRYGDESFEALAEMESWSPTYFPSGLSGEAVAEALEEHGHGHRDGEEAPEYDEHVWTSPLNALRITEAIAEVFCELDSANQAAYRENAGACAEELRALDAAFREVMETARRHTLIFGDRFPFRYFVEEYGLDYYAAFPGCSTETEPSVKTVAFLIDKVGEEDIPVVFHIEFSNEKMADTICEATGAQKLLLHSCHNVTRDDFAQGVGYMELMWNNLEALKEAVA